MSRGPVGPAHDAARLAARRRRATTSRAARRDLALFEPAPSTCADDGRRPLPDEHRHARRRCSPARAAAARRGGDGRRRRAPTSSPPRACSRRCSTRCACDVERRSRASEPFLHPGPRARACWPAARTSAGSASCTRSSRARGTSTTAPRVRARPRPRRSRRADAVPRYDDLTSFPALRQDLAVVAARRRARPRACSTSCARPAATLLAGARVFDVYRGEQVGEGRRSLALRARVPRARPHADRRGRRARRASASSPRCATSWGASCVAERRRRRRRRATPARWPPRLLRPPSALRPRGT